MSSDKHFTEQTYDQFTKLTTTTSKPEKILLEKEGARQFFIGIRHIKAPNFESLLIDVKLNTRKWMFLKKGSIIFLLDAEPINLTAYENYSNVLGHSQSGFDLGMEESVYYRIDKIILEKMCNSNAISIRIEGLNTYLEFSGNNVDRFKLMCQQFYNNYYDSTQYTDSLNKSSGCFIATCVLGDYDHPVVKDLRFFRDNWLVNRKYGITFTNWYYKHGPRAANIISKSLILKYLTFLLIVKPIHLIVKLFKY